ncbi:hypothetical protein VNO77_33787 [Canavalia gladiata]|uniref:Uncharacterized protein n=1 Tax=Canavalia gladiata TaxID=3824 RepID=A0AAN9KCH5_CANGL
MMKFICQTCYNAFLASEREFRLWNALFFCTVSILSCSFQHLVIPFYHDIDIVTAFHGGALSLSLSLNIAFLSPVLRFVRKRKLKLWSCHGRGSTPGIFQRVMVKELAAIRIVKLDHALLLGDYRDD